MPDGSHPLTLRTVGHIAEVAAAEWDACAGEDNPFVCHAFLRALEDSGSVDAATGWLAQHLLAFDGTGRLVGCVPAYLKGHSYGEYVFDWSWAEAWQRAGGRYYPKLQVAVPFTPVTGPRLLVRPGAPPAVAEALGAALRALVERQHLSSAHVTFAREEDLPPLQRQGFLLRLGYQYHWHNAGYGSFDDFLAALSSRKRKAIRKERTEVAASGLTLRILTGDAIGERHWAAVHRFYRDTVARKWAHAYLTRAFFFRLGEVLADRIVLIVAETAGGRVVAAALNLLGKDTLFGRYWGCEADFRFLHFELCYYRAIDFALARGLARVEAGAQGEHKIQRGYLPTLTRSAHFLADDGLRRAIERFLRAEAEAVRADVAALSARSPFRRDGAGSG